MTKPAAPETVEDVQALLQIIELEGIETYEIRGIGINRGVEDFEETYAIKAAVNVGPEFLHTRFTLTFESKSGQYIVDLAVRYRIEKENVVIPQAITVELAERVGIMAAFPFLREQLYGLATRLGHPVPVHSYT
jgi:hypothetical protein